MRVATGRLALTSVWMTENAIVPDVTTFRFPVRPRARSRYQGLSHAAVLPSLQQLVWVNSALTTLHCVHLLVER